MKIRNIIGSCCVIAAISSSGAEPVGSLPQLEEVYHLLQANLPGADPTKLDRAAIKGLLTQYQSKAMLVSETTSNGQFDAVAPLGKAVIFDGSYAYFRVSRVGGNLARDLMNTYRGLCQTNKSKIKGAVLDLRFTDGDDYACAGATANCFLNSNQPLLDWGTGTARATTKNDSISMPLAVLVNSQTAEAAEALAVALRESKAALLIGGKTAGQANVFKEFSLANGDKLRIAVGQIKLGDGTACAGALEPDIAVNTSAADEQAYLQDPYKTWATASNVDSKGGASGRAGGNRGSYRRYNEVELIKEHREGANLEEQFWPKPFDDDAPSTPDAAPVVTDPALARGLDLLKGLAVVQENHPG